MSIEMTYVEIFVLPFVKEKDKKYFCDKRIPDKLSNMMSFMFYTDDDKPISVYDVSVNFPHIEKNVIKSTDEYDSGIVIKNEPYLHEYNSRYWPYFSISFKLKENVESCKLVLACFDYDFKDEIKVND